MLLLFVVFKVVEYRAKELLRGRWTEMSLKLSLSSLSLGFYSVCMCLSSCWHFFASFSFDCCLSLYLSKSSWEDFIFSSICLTSSTKLLFSFSKPQILSFAEAFSLLASSSLYPYLKHSCSSCNTLIPHSFWFLMQWE